MLTCGLVRKKNAGHLMMLNFAAYVFAFLAYYAVGYAFQFGAVALNASPTNLGGIPMLNHFLMGSGHWGFVGGKGFFLVGPAYDSASNCLTLFEVVFMETAGYIIVGAVCERITFWAFLLCELFIGAILYPISGCWAWGGGWLSQVGSTLNLGHGYVDFAGSSVVHAVGGFCAMALAIILGPRLGKYGPDGKIRIFPAHNIVYVVSGTFILLFGWMGFNPGSTLGATDLRISVVAVNTNLAAVAGSAAAMLLWYLLFGKPDITMACNGMLAGLVAITAAVRLCVSDFSGSHRPAGGMPGLRSACCSTTAFSKSTIPAARFQCTAIVDGLAPSASAFFPTASTAPDGMAWAQLRTWVARAKA